MKSGVIPAISPSSQGKWNKPTWYKIFTVFSLFVCSGSPCPEHCSYKASSETLVCINVRYHNLPLIFRCLEHNPGLKEVELETVGFICNCVWVKFLQVMKDRNIRVLPARLTLLCFDFTFESCGLVRTRSYTDVPRADIWKFGQEGSSEGRGHGRLKDRLHASAVNGLTTAHLPVPWILPTPTEIPEIQIVTQAPGEPDTKKLAKKPKKVGFKSRSRKKPSAKSVSKASQKSAVAPEAKTKTKMIQKAEVLLPTKIVPSARPTHEIKIPTTSAMTFTVKDIGKKTQSPVASVISMVTQKPPMKSSPLGPKATQESPMKSPPQGPTATQKPPEPKATKKPPTQSPQQEPTTQKPSVKSQSQEPIATQKPPTQSPQQEPTTTQKPLVKSQPQKPIATKKPPSKPQPQKPIATQKPPTKSHPQESKATQKPPTQSPQQEPTATQKPLVKSQPQKPIVTQKPTTKSHPQESKATQKPPTKSLPQGPIATQKPPMKSQPQEPKATQKPSTKAQMTTNALLKTTQKANVEATIKDTKKSGKKEQKSKAPPKHDVDMPKKATPKPTNNGPPESTKQSPSKSPSKTQQTTKTVSKTKQKSTWAPSTPSNTEENSKQVSNGSAIAAQSSNDNDKRVKEEGKPIKHGMVLIIGILAGVVSFAAVIGFIIWLAFNDDSQKDPPRSDTSLLEAVIHPERVRYSHACLRTKEAAYQLTPDPPEGGSMEVHMVQRDSPLKKIPAGKPFQYP